MPEPTDDTLRDETALMDSITAALRAGEQEHRPKRQPLSGLSTFLLTFLFSLLILVTGMYGVLRVTGGERLFGGETSAPSGGETDLSLADYRPALSDGKRLLVVAGERPLCWVLRIDPKSGTLTAVTLPPNTVSGNTTPSGAAAAVEELLGAGSIDRVLLLDSTGLSELIDRLGGMEWTFSDRYQSETLDIPVGRHLLDGATVLQLMNEEGSGGLPGSGEILCAFLGQRFTAETLDNDAFFQAVAAHSAGTVSAVDYYDSKKFLRWYLGLSSDSKTLTLTGAEDGLSAGELSLAREKLGIS
jgi:hypothetical protein